MGHLTVILGCMFAQKSSELLLYLHRYQSIHHRVLIVKSHLDTRFGDEEAIITHDGRKARAEMVENLAEVEDKVRSGEYQALLVDEGQFFGDLVEQVTRWADECPIHIVVAGLDGTFEREPFGGMLRLIPHAEEVIRLSAMCAICRDGTKAIYSKRKECGKQVLVVAGSDIYHPVCRKHYLEE